MEIYQQISKILRISPSILKWPGVLTNLIIPFILFSYVLKDLLEEIKIFRSPRVHWMLSILLSLSALTLISSLGPIIAVISILFISHKKISGIWGIVLGIIVVIIYFFIPSLIGLLIK